MKFWFNGMFDASFAHVYNPSSAMTTMWVPIDIPYGIFLWNKASPSTVPISFVDLHLVNKSGQEYMTTIWWSKASESYKILNEIRRFKLKNM